MDCCSRGRTADDEIEVPPREAQMLKETEGRKAAAEEEERKRALVDANAQREEELCAQQQQQQHAQAAAAAEAAAEIAAEAEAAEVEAAEVEAAATEAAIVCELKRRVRPDRQLPAAAERCFLEAARGYEGLLADLELLPYRTEQLEHLTDAERTGWEMEAIVQIDMDLKGRTSVLLRTNADVVESQLVDGAWRESCRKVLQAHCCLDAGCVWLCL